MLGYDLHCINMNLVRWIIWDMDNIIVLEIGQLHVPFFKNIIKIQLIARRLHILCFLLIRVNIIMITLNIDQMD